MNQQLVIQQLREGEKPIGKEMVRDMLQNRIYTGRVPYAETFYSGSLGQGKKSSRRRKQWFEGKHEGFISDELFDKCQQVRQQLTKVRHSPSELRAYLLHDRVYCARCVGTKPTELLENFGKYREACERVGQPDEARQQLLAKIVDRVFVYDDHVIAIALHGDFSVVLDNATFAPHKIVEGLRAEIKKGCK